MSREMLRLPAQGRVFLLSWVRSTNVRSSSYSLTSFLRCCPSQLDVLQLCYPSNLYQFINKLPRTLTKRTPRLMLRGINKTQANSAYRLFQSLTVAFRSLRVEELAELLAFDFQGSSLGGILTLKKDWWWYDEEEAVISTCSSLITIVRTYFTQC